MMAAAAEEEIVSVGAIAGDADCVAPAPPRAPAALPDDFVPPAVVQGIEGAAGGAGGAGDAPVAAYFASLSARLSRAVRVSNSSLRGAVGAVVPAASRVPLPAVLLFGDSITERAVVADVEEHGVGWGVLLQGEYAGACDVVCRGYSGYNSRWALSVLPRVLRGVQVANVRVVFILLGANDAVEAGAPQHVGIDEYKFNLSKLAHFVSTVRRMSPIVPVVITPPPIVAAMREESARDAGFASAVRSPERAQLYAEGACRMAAALGIPVVDLHSAMVAEAEKDAGGDAQAGLAKYFHDGLHFNGEGNRFLANLVTAAIREHVPDMAPERLSRPFVHWTEIDPERPTEALGASELT